jgi:hypothetical protein
VAGRRQPSPNGDSRADAAGGPLTSTSMPRLWYWTTVVIFVFVLAGIVIAITRLA